jgi:hypothetical protein
MEFIHHGNAAKKKIDANQIHSSISLRSISFTTCIQFCAIFKSIYRKELLKASSAH